MDLELSAEESELRDNVRSVLASVCPPAAVRAVFEGKGDAASIWERMVELYWPALAIAEEHGGLGMGFVEVALVAEELGRAVVPGPFLATVTQFAPAVRELGGDAPLAADLLGRIAAGGLTGTWPWPRAAAGSRPRWPPPPSGPPTAGSCAAPRTRCSTAPPPTRSWSSPAPRARRAPTAWGRSSCPVPTSPATPRTVVDPTLAAGRPRARRGRGAGRPGARRARAPMGWARPLDRAGQEAIVALAASTVGACRAIFEQTVAYAKERVQYDRAIGSFQALKHRMADMYLAVERATSLCYFAALDDRGGGPAAGRRGTWPRRRPASASGWSCRTACSCTAASA